MKKEITNKGYCEKYDVYFDKDTGDWLEKRCGDLCCEYCGNRPKRHTPHKWQFINLKRGICE